MMNRLGDQNGLEQSATLRITALRSRSKVNTISADTTISQSHTVLNARSPANDVRLLRTTQMIYGLQAPELSVNCCIPLYRY